MKNQLQFAKNETRFSFIFFSCFLIMMFSAEKVVSQTFPSGFSRVQVTAGLSNPTAMVQAPDGRLFITQQGGALKVVKNGALLGTSAINLTVDGNGERGLIGIALDPNFSSNNFVYLYYTVPSPAHNRVSRFTFSGDVIVGGSEVILLELNNLSSATNHNGGSMAFGADGKLYIAVGDNANGSNAQTLDNYLGKILRINSNGTVPTGNPFSGSASKDRIWSYGLRNPYTITFQPGTGKLFINDVGQNTWEEINDGTVGGRNFGWPNAEGTCSSNCSGYTNPVYAYQHGSGDGKGCAITGGTFFNPISTNYPSVYAGKYFFVEYCNNWINYIDPANPSTRNSFATNIGGSSLSIITGVDGKLYYLSRTNGALYRVDYNSGSSPTITSQPQSVTVTAGSSATFSVTATGATPLSYQWRKDGTIISGATGSTYTISNAQSADAGTYSVVVTNSSGSTTSSNAALTVSTSGVNPTASITTPSNNSTYRGGDVINFSGTGTDPQDGNLPSTAFTWSVIFHHDTHTHPGPSVSVSSTGTSGSFAIPTLGETESNVWYELVLTVKDSNGNINTTSVRINPVTSTLTLASSPSGLQAKLDDQPVTTPYSVTAVSGMVRNLDVVTPQTVNGSTYVFNNWSNTTTQRQDVTVSDNATTYTAVFYRVAEVPTNVSAGLNYSYYEGSWSILPDFSALTAAKTGTVTNFDLSPRNRDDQFGFVFTGYVNVPTDGVYTFYTTSDDGSNLYIGNTLVVNNDGLHASRERSGTIGLKAGKHALKVTFFEQGGGQLLSVSYSGPGISKTAIPASALSRGTVAPPASTNLALGKPTSVSSTENSSLLGPNAVDGNASSRWSSAFSDPQWIYVDLGSVYNINRVKLVWEAAYGKDYKVQITNNPSGTWSDIKTVTGNTSLVNDHTGLSGSGQYVRIYGTARGTGYGYSLYEYEVYGTSASADVANMGDAFTETESEMLSIHPNPTIDNISIKAKDIKSLELFNDKGITVLKGTQNLQNLSLSGLPAGIYVLKVRTVNGIYTKKIMKQ